MIKTKERKKNRKRNREEEKVTKENHQNKFKK
jgi:hypothetical protein